MLGAAPLVRERAATHPLPFAPALQFDAESSEASAVAAGILKMLTGVSGPADASPTLVAHTDAVHRLGGGLMGLASLTGLSDNLRKTATRAIGVMANMLGEPGDHVMVRCWERHRQQDCAWHEHPRRKRECGVHLVVCRRTCVTTSATRSTSCCASRHLQQRRPIHRLRTIWLTMRAGAF